MNLGCGMILSVGGARKFRLPARKTYRCSDVSISLYIENSGAQYFSNISCFIGFGIIYEMIRKLSRG